MSARGWAWPTVHPSASVERFREVVNRSLLELEGALGRVPARVDVQTVSAHTALTGTAGLVLVNTAGGSVTITLPEAAINRGRLLMVKKISVGNTVTLVGVAGELIDGASSLSWALQYQSYSLVSDGTDWWIV